MNQIQTVQETEAAVEKFYNELLFILGLEETGRGRRRLLRPMKAPHPGSFIENIFGKVVQLPEGKIEELTYYRLFEGAHEERSLDVAYELMMLWLCRILFLKYLEAQLLNFHNNQREYAFLSENPPTNFKELNTLFFEVMGISADQRKEELQDRYPFVPWMGISLFEQSLLEEETFYIYGLSEKAKLPLYKNSVLKDQYDKHAQIPFLEYLLNFLDTSGLFSANKEASLSISDIGLILERLSGYQEGVFNLPVELHENTLDQYLRERLLDKFNQQYKKKFESVAKLKAFLDKKKKPKELKEAAAILSSLKVMDPAVGSGALLIQTIHLLLNLQLELGLLLDTEGKRVKAPGSPYKVISDQTPSYSKDKQMNPGSAVNEIAPEVQRFQEASFEAACSLIVNSIHGVDINPMAVRTCRFRLWATLLQYIHYSTESGFSEFKQLPNIDINIKWGDAIVNRFRLSEKMKDLIRSGVYDVEEYKRLVSAYILATKKEQKREARNMIEELKKSFNTSISNQDKRVKRLIRLEEKYFLEFRTPKLLDLNLSQEQKSERNRLRDQLETSIRELKIELEQERTGELFNHSLEWRFEFPDLLDEKGNFVGFDLVVCNPPRLRQEHLKHLKAFFRRRFKSYNTDANIYFYFMELGFRLLNEKGRLLGMIPDNWQESQSGKSFRRWMDKPDKQVLLKEFTGQPLKGAGYTLCLLGIVNEPSPEKSLL